MQSIDHDSRIHHKTVTELSKQEPRRKQRKAPTRKNGPVVVKETHPEVWAECLRLAEGDTSRIQRLSYDDCVVHNPGVNWKKR